MLQKVLNEGVCLCYMSLLTYKQVGGLLDSMMIVLKGCVSGSVGRMCQCRRRDMV